MNIKKIIKEEMDDFDWIKDQLKDVNPFVMYDNIKFDIEPTRDEVNKYIEMALTKKHISNRDSWNVNREDDIDNIINYYSDFGVAYLGIDDVGDLCYGHQPRLNSINYSELLNKENKINESDDFDWIKDVPSGKILENNVKYRIDCCEDGFDEELFKNKLIELFGDGFTQYSNHYVNWFNNPNISIRGTKVRLLLTPYLYGDRRCNVKGGWLDCNSHYGEYDSLPTLTVEEFLNSSI